MLVPFQTHELIDLGKLMVWALMLRDSSGIVWNGYEVIIPDHPWNSDIHRTPHS